MDSKLDIKNIPEGLRELISMAEKFGISDDGYRYERLKNSSPEELAELRSLCEEKDDELDDWLAGPESDGPRFSDEYIAYSAMRMAADEA